MKVLLYIWLVDGRGFMSLLPKTVLLVCSMSGQRLNSQTVEPKGRLVGGTEYSWGQAVPGGTGVAVLALLVSKAPDISRLQNAVHKLQNSHPILRSRIHSSSTSTQKTMSFITSPAPFVQINSFSTSSTSGILESFWS